MKPTASARRRGSSGFSGRPAAGERTGPVRRAAGAPAVGGAVIRSAARSAIASSRFGASAASGVHQPSANHSRWLPVSSGTDRCRRR